MFAKIRTGFVRVMENLEVMEFYDFIFHAWKVMEFRCGSWKVKENHVDYTK